MKDSKTNVNYLTIGDKVKNRRTAMGLSQEKLAELCGVTPSYIGHIERGSRSLSLTTAVSISAVLNMSLDYLLLDVKNDSIAVFEGISADLKNHDPQKVEIFINTVKILAANIDNM